MRRYFNEFTKPYLLIDLGSGIFESATVDSNILLFEKNTANNPFTAVDLSKETNFIDFSVYEKMQVEVSYKNDDIWSIDSPLEKSIKQKIEKKGTPLKDWDIEINYGIKTGYNEAFIITKEKRDELIAKDPKSAEIIHPILRGRDIKRYSIDFNDLYLISTHNGYKDNSKINIDNYSIIKSHLDQYYEKLEKRYDKGDTPYNLRNCAYIDKFNGEKIIYQEMVQESSFAYHERGTMFCVDTGRIITGKNLKYILTIVNTNFFFWCIKNFYAGGGLGKKGVRMKYTFFEKFPLIKAISEELFIEKADQMLVLNKKLQEVSAKFQRTLQRKFPESLEKLPKKLASWYELSFTGFIKELKKKKIPLSLSEEAEWEDYFIAEQQKAFALKTQIDTTDKEIDQMVYELYGLIEEEIEIVENS
ncbi:MAG: hypothetical protein GKR88_16900 [Flavobacteriaceae bacterium]|nr:MAG: hypothetical protein GKR88_16900 [Flavobacteriaceae bacterium]